MLEEALSGEQRQRQSGHLATRGAAELDRRELVVLLLSVGAVALARGIKDGDTMILGRLALAQTTSPYRRPGSARQLAALPEITGPEQVHLSLGGPSEMVITYATADEAPSSVEWWDASGATLTADGTAAAYSQLIYIEDELLDPAIGLGDTNASTLLDMQNTSAWASRDPFYGLRHGHGSSYHSSSEVRTKLLSYKNPQAIYNSPLVHTVRLSNLLPSATYGYRVGGGSDARNFSFTMPPDGDGAAFPLTFGLTADIGQTVVSKLNAEWLLSQLSDAEPYAARNSSDGAAQIAAQIL